MSQDIIDKLVAMGIDPEAIAKVQHLAAKEMERNGYGYTLRNACAATLSTFLIQASINVPITLGAGRLASRLISRGWVRVEVGDQQPGDVGVTLDNNDRPGADHVYLVVSPIDRDEMWIADNQSPKKHRRRASGGGKTQTEYFLRLSEPQLAAALKTHTRSDDFYPVSDDGTKGLREPFDDHGSPNLPE